MIKKTHTSPLSVFIDFDIEDNIIYFPLCNYNAVCKGNLVDDQVEIIDIFPDMAEEQKDACLSIYKMKDYLLFYERAGNSIFVYNILQRKFSQLFSKEKMNFFSNSVFEKNDYIYIVAIRTAQIYKIDLQNISLQCFTYKKYISDNVKIGDIVRIDDYIYIPLNTEKDMLTFDLNREKFECYKYPENISVIYNQFYYSGKLWIIGENGKIYTWNIEDSKACMCVEFPNEIERYIIATAHFSQSFIIIKDVLWIFPPSNIILKYNVLTKHLEVLNIPDEEVEEGQFINCKYDTIKHINDKVFLSSSKTKVLYELDLLTNKIQKHCFQIPNIFNGRLYPMPVGGKMLEKNYANAFDVLLKSIMEYSDNSKIVEKGIVGKTINEYINNDSTK